MDQRPQFSIIVPLWHGGACTDAMLQSACHLDFPTDRCELVVAGGPQHQPERQAVEKAAGQAPFALHYVAAASGNRSMLLNAACALAKGEIWLFVDDDCQFPADFLHRWNQAWQRLPQAAMLGGREQYIGPVAGFNLALDWVLGSFMGTGGYRSAQGRQRGRYYPHLWNMALTATAARGVALAGGNIFDESLVAHEDIELAQRVYNAGLPVAFADEACVMHARDTTLGKFAYRNFANARTARSVGAHRLPHLLLAAFVVGMPALAAASWWSRLAALALSSVLVVYILLLAASAVVAAWRKKSTAALWWVPPLCVIVHIARGVGFLLPWPRRQQ